MEKLYQKAVELFNEEKFRKSISVFKKLNKKGFNEKNTLTDIERNFNLKLRTYQDDNYESKYTSPKKAVNALRVIADLNFPSAQDYLGELLCEGIAVEQDYCEAVKLFTKAAGKKSYNAMYNLGCCYANGNGVKQDYKKAYDLFLKVATQTEENTCYDGAMLSLGTMYEKGLGVDKNLESAIEWYVNSAFLNNEDAMKELERIHRANKVVVSSVDFNKLKIKISDENTDLDDVILEAKQVFAKIF